ncbi:MAG: FAS1-like dehydratase domain-containing protein [Solirubrobacteraceae bacterium]
MSGALAQGSWSDAEALVGQVIGSFAGPDPVSVADIRRKLEVLAFDCPLHYNEEIARVHGYRAIVAPVSMTRAWAIPSYWEPGRPRSGAEPLAVMFAAANVPGEGDTMIATAIRCEHFEPLHPGDRVAATAVLRSVERKTTRVGSGAFLVVDTTFVNQRGETVTVETSTLFRYRRSAST